MRPACPEWLEALCILAEGAEPPFEEEETLLLLDAHLAECSACRAELEALRGLDTAVKLSGHDDPGPAFTRELLRSLPPRRSPSFAAALAVLLASGAGSTGLLLLAGLAGAWFWLGADRALELLRGAWAGAAASLSACWSTLPATLPYLVGGALLAILAGGVLGCFLARSSLSGLRRAVTAQ